MARKLGLPMWDGKGPIPTADYYHIDHLVTAIWKDPEYYEGQRRHIWDDYEIQHERDGWQFGGTWAFSQRQETLKELKDRLTLESGRITPIKGNLKSEKSNLERDGQAFANLLKNIEEDYIRHHKRIPSYCHTCEDWLKELGSLGASIDLQLEESGKNSSAESRTRKESFSEIPLRIRLSSNIR